MSNVAYKRVTAFITHKPGQNGREGEYYISLREKGKTGEAQFGLLVSEWFVENEDAMVNTIAAAVARGLKQLHQAVKENDK